MAELSRMQMGFCQWVSRSAMNIFVSTHCHMKHGLHTKCYESVCTPVVYSWFGVLWIPPLVYMLQNYVMPLALAPALVLAIASWWVPNCHRDDWQRLAIVRWFFTSCQFGMNLCRKSLRKVTFSFNDNNSSQTICCPLRTTSVVCNFKMHQWMLVAKL